MQKVADQKYYEYLLIKVKCQIHLTSKVIKNEIKIFMIIVREEEVDTCGYATYLEMALKEVYKIVKGVLL